jgi:hypothetical protein
MRDVSGHSTLHRRAGLPRGCILKPVDLDGSRRRPDTDRAQFGTAKDTTA